MLCALTVRTLKPGTFDEFRVAFTSALTGFDVGRTPQCRDLARRLHFQRHE